jgi:hypothetical protein
LERVCRKVEHIITVPGYYLILQQVGASKASLVNYVEVAFQLENKTVFRLEEPSPSAENHIKKWKLIQ